MAHSNQTHNTVQMIIDRNEKNTRPLALDANCRLCTLALAEMLSGNTSVCEIYKLHSHKFLHSISRSWKVMLSESRELILWLLFCSLPDKFTQNDTVADSAMHKIIRLLLLFNQISGTLSYFTLVMLHCVVELKLPASPHTGSRYI